jgi:hypothetical protein
MLSQKTITDRNILAYIYIYSYKFRKYFRGIVSNIQFNKYNYFNLQCKHKCCENSTYLSNVYNMCDIFSLLLSQRSFSNINKNKICILLFMHSNVKINFKHEQEMHVLLFWFCNDRKYVHINLFYLRICNMLENFCIFVYIWNLFLKFGKQLAQIYMKDTDS